MTPFRAILADQLRRDEGIRYRPYRDTVGKWTIGVGRNLDDVGVHEDEVALMLENDIAQAEILARTLVPNFDELTDNRKAVVCNMAFNLGPKLSGFTQTLQAVKEGRWSDAADNMMNSMWAKQVGLRARRLADQMKEG